MKTIVHIELTDEQRTLLAEQFFGKPNSRLITRNWVTEATEAFVAGMLAYVEASTGSVETVTERSDSGVPSTPPRIPFEQRSLRIDEPDPEDAEFLADKPPSYIRGWNKVKYKLGHKA